MLRNNLLLTTAFVVAASFSSLAAGPAALAQSPTVAPARDRNEEFLCAYGGFQVSEWALGSSISSYKAGWANVAAPINGRDRTVDSITVKEGRRSSIANGTFSAGIYSNMPSGLPGNPISVGRGKAGVNCGKITISIAPTKLARNKTYWVEETISGVRNWKRDHDLEWATDPGAKRKAYRQYNHHGASGQSSYTSPWTEQSAGVYLRVR